MQTRVQFEIEHGIAAFFDLDGTLLTPPSLERRYFHLLRRGNLIGARQYFAWFCEAARMLPLGIQYCAHANKMYLRGVPVHTARLEASFLPFYREAIERMKWHAARGHFLVIVSGALEPLAQWASAELTRTIQTVRPEGNIRVRATRLEEKGARWTGRILEEAMFGEAKARAVRRIADEAGLDLQRCFAYGDSVYDCPMLETVGQPAAVNPSPNLACIARRNNWSILRWSELHASTLPASLPSRAENEIGAIRMHVQPAASAQMDSADAQMGLKI